MRFASAILALTALATQARAILTVATPTGALARMRILLLRALSFGGRARRR